MGIHLYNNNSPHPSAVELTQKFLESERFDRFFQDGMALVEETAQYLEGPGRGESKKLSRTAAMCYAAESMRLTTRLMQLASWLLLQRAVKQGELTQMQAQQEKAKIFDSKRAHRMENSEFQSLPETLQGLVTRTNQLVSRARHVEETLLPKEHLPRPNQVAAQHTAIESAFTAAPEQPAGI